MRQLINKIVNSTAGGTGLLSARTDRKLTQTEPACRCVVTEKYKTKQNVWPSCNIWVSEQHVQAIAVQNETLPSIIAPSCS